MQVHTSNGISTILSIVQKDESIEVVHQKAYFHIEEVDGILHLYVPANKKTRSVCLCRNLPASLLKHFGARKLSAGPALGSIITASNLFAVDEFLLQDGIISVSGINRPTDEDDGEDEDDEEAPGGVPTHLMANNAAPTQAFTTESVVEERSLNYSRSRADSQATTVVSLLGGNTTGAAINFTFGAAPQSSDFTFQPAGTLNPRVIPVRSDRVALYRQLLDITIRQAQSLGETPTKGNTVLSSLPGSLGFDPEDAVRSEAGDDHYVNIGAAGELMVSTNTVQSQV